jgi:predicted enzyme related to lactoylglutathione lyase
MKHGNAINWFEIPVNDFDRSRKFYETIFNYLMPESMMGTTRMGFFLYDFEEGKIGGAIVRRAEDAAVGENATLVYLNCQPDLQVVADRVEAAGGKLLVAKTPVAPGQNFGYWALMLDTEGNKVALHSMG